MNPFKLSTDKKCLNSVAIAIPLGILLVLSACDLKNDAFLPNGQSFEFIYDRVDFDNVIAIDVKQDPQTGGYVLLSRVGQDSVPMIIKTDSLGNERWRKVMGGLGNPIPELRVQADGRISFFVDDFDEAVLVHVNINSEGATSGVVRDEDIIVNTQEITFELPDSCGINGIPFVTPFYASANTQNGNFIAIGADLFDNVNLFTIFDQNDEIERSICRSFDDDLLGLEFPAGKQGIFTKELLFGQDCCYAFSTFVPRPLTIDSIFRNQWSPLRLEFVNFDGSAANIVRFSPQPNALNFEQNFTTVDVSISSDGNLPGDSLALAWASTDNYFLAFNSLDNIGGNFRLFSELEPGRRVLVQRYTRGGFPYFICIGQARNNRILLFGFNESGELQNKRFLGDDNPYRSEAITVTQDGGIAVLGTTFVAGRFARPVLFKLSAKEVGNLIGIP